MFKIHFLEKILSYYFFIFIISTIIGLMGGKQYLISVFFPILLFILAFKCGIGRKNIIDLFFFLIILSMLFSWLTNYYPNKDVLIFRCIMAEGAYMASYFIGKRIGEQCLNDILSKSIIPLIVCCLLGIYFFFRPPAWYLAQLYNSQYYMGSTLSLEMLRLRSIFSSPYVVSYMCGITSIFLFFRIFRNKETEVKSYIICGLFFITMCFCMMRAPLSCVIISFIIALYYHSVNSGNIKTFILSIGGIVAILSILTLFLQSVNSDMLYYITDKFDSVVYGQDELLETRVNLWDYKYDYWGDGAGRHALIADDYNAGTSIRDSEYIKILVEQGYIGLYIYILFLAACLVKCIRYFKYLPFEFCIVIFYVICMIGANPLSTGDKHCFIFWMTVGRIAAFKKNDNVK